VSTGKLNYFSVCCGKASNRHLRDLEILRAPSCPSWFMKFRPLPVGSQLKRAAGFELSLDLCDNSSP